jgi:aspartyl-tRNA synthetase
MLNASKTPPFTIEDDTDGGDDLRMKYRYLDLRRNAVQQNIIFRSNLAIETRKYLPDRAFVEIETPFSSNPPRKAPATSWCPAA